MKKLKLFFALFAMLALGMGNAWAEEATLDFSALYSADTDVSSTEFKVVDGITLKFAKGSGSTAPKYYSSGSSVRLYAKGTMTISSTIGNITGITLAYGTSDKTNAITTDCGTFLSPNWTGNSSSVIFTIGGTSGHRRIKSVTVTYTPSSGGGEDPTPDPEEPDPTPGMGGDATMTEGTNGTACTVNEKGGIKVGTSSKGGDMKITVPAGATMLHVYAAAWNNVSGLSLNITPNDKVTTTSIALKADAGIANSTPFTLSGNESDYLFDIPLQNITVETTLTFTSSAAKRFVVWGATCETVGGGESEPVIVKTLKSIAVTGMTTTFEQGDVFKFDGTCTATYSVTKDGVAQDDETAEVTPTSVSEPDMTTIGTKEVTVTYETVSTTYDITITENEVTAGAYNVLLNNELWNVTAGQQAASVESMTGKSNDITFYTTKGSSQMYASATQTRFYNGATFVISVPNGYVIKSIVFTEPTSDKKWDGSINASVGAYDDGTKSWSGNAQEVIFSFAAQNRIANASITFEAVDLTLPSAPTFNPEAGTYNTVQNVTISAEAGTTIYYTLDGIDPTTGSNVYSTPIEIAETKTLKAIAVKDEKVSPIASATYTIKLPLTTMDQIFAKATAVGSTATSVEITFGNWVVSAVKEDGKTAFVTDGTKGFVIYEAGCGFKVGDVLSGTAACKVLLYNGFAELTGLTSSTTGLSVTTGGAITTQELDAAGIAALTGVNTGSLIKINGTCTSESSKYYVADVQIYTSLYDFGTLEVGAEYNITGIYQPYNATKEMLPRSAADIEKVVGIPTATISIADITMEIGQEKTIEATITPDAAQSTVQYGITSGNEYITLEGTTITAVAAGEATITATIAEKADEYKGATKEFIVTVKPQNIAELPFTFNGGKAGIENTLGMSQTGLDDDYGSAPKLKFNGAGDNVIVHFDSQAGEFSFVLKQNGQNAGTFTVYESANGEDYSSVWAGGDFGNAQSETIKPTLSESARYVKFEYTTKGASTNYGLGSISIQKADHRAEAGIAWNPTSVTLTQGEAFAVPTLQYPNDITGTITYESSNEDVATVSAAGVIDLVDDAVGTATITASFLGDATYKPATATCTIKVKPVQEDCEGSDDFETATTANNDATSYKSRTTDAGWKATNAAKTTIEGYTYLIINGKKSEVGTITSPVLNGGLGSIKIRYANTYSESNGVSFRLDIKQNDEVVKTYTITKAKAEVVQNTVYTELIEDINVEGDFVMVFTNLSPSKDTGNKDRVSIGRLCWTGFEAPTPVEIRTGLTAGNYYTICMPKAMTNVQGATLWSFCGKDANFAYLVQEDAPYTAGMAYIMYAEAETVSAILTGDEEAAPVANGAIHGTFVPMDQAALTAAGDNIYLVIGNQLRRVDGQTGNSLPANRAYVDIDEITGGAPAGIPANRVRSMPMQPQVTTGMENVDASAQPVKMIINGQLYILRGEKMYDAQGKLVK